MPTEDTLKKTFMTNLNRLLQKHDASQADLAAYMGVSNTTVNNWVRGHKMPRMDKIDKICLFFSIHRSDLLNPQDNNEPMEAQSPIPTDDLPDLNARDEREITRMMDDMKEKLMQEEGLMFDGQPATPASIQSILDAMQIGMEMAKKRNKVKYTPKKFRHED